jgi:aminomethyltransferase
MIDNISYKKPLLETPFHSKTSELCYSNEWYRWGGYKIVKEYTQTELEYTAMRNTAGVLDITPMYKYSVKGKDAKKFINKLITRDINNISSNQIVYGLWCNENGFVVDDGTIFCFDNEHFRICCAEKNLIWFEDSAIGFDVNIEDITKSIGALAFQGPLSCKILKLLEAKNIENLQPFYFDNFIINKQEVMISRTGFSGDLGYEIWCDPSQAHDVYDALFSFNNDYKVLPCGMNSLEMVRIEAGFIQPNADFIPSEQALRPNRMKTPLELGMSWIVNLEKDFFTGKAALIKQKSTGVESKLVGLDIEGDKPAHGAILYNVSKKDIGIVTGAMWSPTLKANIAIGYVNKDYMKIGSKVYAEIYHPEELEYRKIWAECKVVKKQFFNNPRKNATPAFV